MNPRGLRAGLASIILMALPVAEFVRNGQVSESALGALLILAFGGGGFAADKALKSRIRKWAEEADDEGS